jgi:hypothetical protein
MVLATVEQRAAMEAENSRIASEITAFKLINTTSDARIAELTAIVKTFERMLYGTARNACAVSGWTMSRSTYRDRRGGDRCRVGDSSQGQAEARAADAQGLCAYLAGLQTH